MKTKLNLTPEEAAQLEKGGKLHFIRLAKAQERKTFIGGQEITVLPSYYCDCFKQYIQYPVGAKLGVKERCAWDTDNGWVYLTDDTPENILHNDDYYLLTEDVPDEAIRKHVTIISNTVKRVQDVGWKDMFVAFLGEKYSQWSYKGKCEEVIKHWNSLYAKPRKQGDGYVCYPYSITDKLAQMYYDWSNKPKVCNLTIYANPYIELPTGRVE